jgi:hypothetical protein
MCNPALFASGAQAVTGLASTALSFKAHQKAYMRNGAAAVEAYGDDIEALNARQDQIGRSASEDILSNQIAALEERGRATAAANGLADVSLGEVLQGVHAQRDRANSNIIFNRDTARQQTIRDKKSAQSTAQSRINAVSRPSLTAYAFKAAGDVLSAGTTYDQLKNRGS